MRWHHTSIQWHARDMMRASRSAARFTTTILNVRRHMTSAASICSETTCSSLLSQSLQRKDLHRWRYGFLKDTGTSSTPEQCLKAERSSQDTSLLTSMEYTLRQVLFFLSMGTKYRTSTETTRTSMRLYSLAEMDASPCMKMPETTRITRLSMLQH